MLYKPRFVDIFKDKLIGSDANIIDDNITVFRSPDHQTFFVLTAKGNFLQGSFINESEFEGN